MLTFGAIIAGPHRLTEARLRLEIKVAVSAATRQALERLLIHLTAVSALPALLADAGALGTETMPRAGRVRAVHLLAELALVATYAVALSIRAVSVSIAIRHLALVVSQ